jgi:hypothetical protein
MSLNFAAAAVSRTSSWGSREASMFRSLRKRATAWLAGVLGPPPPPPRRYFSKALDERAGPSRH